MNPRRFLSLRRIVAIFTLTCLLLLGSQLIGWLSFGGNFHIVGLTGTRSHTKQKTILVWHWPWGSPANLSGDYCKDTFNVPNCHMVDNRSRFSDADLVIFHNSELVRGEEKLPTHLKRKESQRWVWFMESPFSNGNVKQFAGLFNWTMTYHRDADIYSPYAFMVPKASVSNESLQSFFPKDKAHLVCWVVTKFSKDHERTTVYEKLKTVVPIQVYGAAFGNHLDNDALLPTISNCYFYLAFENALLRDYISEQLWRNSFGAGAVPVVYGAPREDYEAVVPADSFIHVEDFSTVEALGKYLKDLAEDKDRYAAYFNWRHKYTIQTKGWMQLLCEFCPKIDSMPSYKVYNDLDAWQH